MHWAWCKAKIVWAICSFIALLPAFASASAEVTRIVVTDQGSMGASDEREYTWVTAAMGGTVVRDDGTTGHYRVPVSIYYPDRAANGVGFVDIVNNADFSNWSGKDAPLGQRQVHYTGNVIFTDYLRQEGYTYIAVQWSRMVTALLGTDYGVIENGLDGYEIIRDAARLLRDLDDLVGDLSPRPPAIDAVIAHGMSSSATLLRGMIWRGEILDTNGALVIDGVLLVAHNGRNCGLLNNDETPRVLPDGTAVTVYFEGGTPCQELPENSKLITLRTQTEGQSPRSRPDEGPGRRLYDLAGTAHIPEFVNDLRNFGATRQNPVDWRPVAKAALGHLVDWVLAGTEPPPSVFLGGTIDDEGVFHMATDADGNALGGVRLPSMPSVLANGEPAGAPLGVYGGREPELSGPGSGYARYSGTFEPFSDEELARRYPTRELYVDLVRRAAAALLAEGFILEDDYQAYIRAAERQALATVTIDPSSILAEVSHAPPADP